MTNNNKIIRLLKNMIEDHDEYFDEAIADSILSRLSKNEVNDVSHTLKLLKFKTNLCGMILHYNYDAFSDVNALKNDTYHKTENILTWERLFKKHDFDFSLSYYMNISITDKEKYIKSNNINFFNAVATNALENSWFGKAKEIGLDKFSESEMAYLGMSFIHDGNVAKSYSFLNNKNKKDNILEVSKVINEYLKINKTSVADMLVNSDFIKYVSGQEGIMLSLKDVFDNMNKRRFYNIGEIKENILNRGSFFTNVKKLYPPEEWLDLYVTDNKLNIKDMFMKKINSFSADNPYALIEEFAHYVPAFKNYEIDQENIYLFYIILLKDGRYGDVFKLAYETFGLPEYSSKTVKMYEKINSNTLVKLSGLEDKVSYQQIIKIADSEKIKKEIDEKIPLNTVKPNKIKL